MNFLSTSGMIGALELDDAPGIDDGALESAARIDAGPTAGCTRPRPFGPCIADGALEAVGGVTVGITRNRLPNTVCL
jgi:hypothetical protein